MSCSLLTVSGALGQGMAFLTCFLDVTLAARKLFASDLLMFVVSTESSRKKRSEVETKSAGSPVVPSSPTLLRHFPHFRRRLGRAFPNIHEKRKRQHRHFRKGVLVHLWIRKVKQRHRRRSDRDQKNPPLSRLSPLGRSVFFAVLGLKLDG